MKLQASITGQMAGHVPDQSGSQLPGLTQPNRNALPQTPNLGGVPRSTINMDPEFLRARTIMQEKIFDILLQRQQHPLTEVHKRRFKDFAKRLEEAMLKTATSKQKSFAYSNGAINSGLGLIGNNRQHTNESGFADAYATTYANSPKHPQQHFDQNQQPPVQGDGYGLNNVDSFASGNFYASATSSGAMMNSQNLNSVKLPAASQTNSVSSHSNLHGMQQAAHLKSQAMNQFEKLNFQSSFTSREGLLDHQQQYLQHSQQFQQPEQYTQQQFEQSEQYAQKQFQLKMQRQQPQHLVNCDAFSQSHLFQFGRSSEV